MQGMPVLMGILIFLGILALMVGPFAVGGYLARKLRARDLGWKMGLIFWSLAVGAVVLIFLWPPKLGIDLSGGVILVYEVDQEKKDPNKPVAMDKLITAVSRRVNPGGVKEVTIRQYGVEQIEIIIPEVNAEEAKRIEQMVSNVGSLEFRILADRRHNGSLIKRAESEDSRVLKDPDGNVLAWWVPVSEREEPSFAHYKDTCAWRMRKKKDSQREITEFLVLKDEFNVTGDYLARAESGVDERGQPCVRFTFDAAGGKLFGGLTGNNLPDPVQKDIKRQLGIILNGELYSAPEIRETIRTHGEITGSFTPEAVADLVDVLNAGSLPAALTKEPISRLQSGPTLGKDTIRKGAWSMGISLLLVLLFMLVYYRFAGIVACAALMMNITLILAIMILIKAAFTLPGLAGLVLTVGMAVDANVLVFERIREELARGAALRMAIRNGFNRATTTIVDANLTTLIVATVLFAIGTDQIKGFAVVLWLGVVLSMYTGVFCSRVVFELAERRRWISKLTMMQMFRSSRIDFMGMRWVAVCASLAVITVGLVGVVLRGKGLLDIDFVGGVRVELLFNEPHRTAKVRERLGSLEALPDLTVSDAQLGDEREGLRYMIDTSNPDIDAVERAVHEAYGKELAANAVTSGEVRQIKPAAPKTDEVVSQKPSPPKGAVHTRNDLPGDSIWAMAGGPPVLLAQAEPSDAEPSGADSASPEDATQEAIEPAEPPAEKPVEPPAEKPAEKPVEKAPEKPAEKPAEKAAQKPAEQPAQKPAAKVEEEAGEPAVEAGADAFAGGSETQLNFAEPVSRDSLMEMFATEFGSETAVPPLELSSPEPGYEEGDGKSYNIWDVKIKLPKDEAARRIESLKARVADTPVFPSSNTIGGKVAGSTRTLAMTALSASLLLIVGYIWIRFQHVVFGLAAVIALVHDVLVTLGMIALSDYVAPFLGFLKIDPFKIGLAVLAAFLTIIGYSLNDTIVVFDRIREVRGKAPRLTTEMINASVNQTLSRTLLTSSTTLIVVVVLYAFGGQGIHAFAFALLVGIVVGTYSSIYVASPLLLWLSRQPQRK